MNNFVNSSAHTRDSEDEDTDRQRSNSVHLPKSNKYYFHSPRDYYNNIWLHSSHTSPVNYWLRFPDGNRQVYNNAPFGNYPPPLITHQSYAHFGNYPQLKKIYIYFFYL